MRIVLHGSVEIEILSFPGTGPSLVEHRLKKIFRYPLNALHAVNKMCRRIFLNQILYAIRF